MEAQSAPQFDHHPEIFAQHYAMGGDVVHASLAWLEAAQDANQRLAYAEVLTHCTRGLEMVELMPVTPKRTCCELSLCLLLGDTLRLLHGVSSAEVERVYSRAQVLCLQLGQLPQSFPALLSLWRFYAVRAEYMTARTLEVQMLELAHTTQDTAQHLAALSCATQSSFLLGNLLEAQSHCEHSLAFYDPQQHENHVQLYGRDFRVICHSFLSLLLWLRGFPTRALEQSRRVRQLARHLTHAPSQVIAYNMAAMFHQFQHEWRDAEVCAEEGLTLLTSLRIPFFGMWGTIMRDWARVAGEQSLGSLTRLGDSIDAWQATGVGMLRPYCLALLAERYAALGQPAQGLKQLTEALAVLATTGERWWEAEIYRLQGELLLQHAPASQAEAETALRQALEVARQQQAKALELRVAMSLGRCRQAQGQRTAAHDLLAEIYSWFSEGFETADLQQARRLLAEWA